MQNIKKIILAMNEVGLVQFLCPECGNILKSNTETKCNKCKAKFSHDEIETRFINPKLN
jgi:predicted RNA-binding Zn-ribbon protein involved in translation (DUF1610 family)